MNGLRPPSRLAALALVLLLGAAPIGGCAIPKLIGGMAQNAEYQKKIEKPAEYSGLEDKRVAVIVEADYATLYEHPNVVDAVAVGIAMRLQQNVPGIRVIDPREVLQWQYQTYQWNALAFGQMAESLRVDRIVYVDIYEYRLNPPGNSWEWEGVCAATVSVIERDSYDPDQFVDSFNIDARFPDVNTLARNEASAVIIEQGLLQDFVKKTSWLFYLHLEPKYPDKYREIPE